MSSMLWELCCNKNIYMTISYNYLNGGKQDKNQWANKCLVCKIYKNSFMILKCTYPILSPLISLVQMTYCENQWFSTLAAHFRITMGVFRRYEALAWSQGQLNQSLWVPSPQPWHLILLNMSRWFPCSVKPEKSVVDQDVGSTGSCYEGIL